MTPSRRSTALQRSSHSAIRPLNAPVTGKHGVRSEARSAFYPHVRVKGIFGATRGVKTVARILVIF